MSINKEYTEQREMMKENGYITLIEFVKMNNLRENQYLKLRRQADENGKMKMIRIGLMTKYFIHKDFDFDKDVFTREKKTEHNRLLLSECYHCF